MTMTLPFLFVAALYFMPAPVAVTIRPIFTMAPGAFLVRAVIEKHEGNRQLILAAVQYGIFHVRSTPFPINGAQSQRVFTPTHKCSCWQDLPAGEYEAVATLTRMEDGRSKLYVSSHQFRVIGMEQP